MRSLTTAAVIPLRGVGRSALRVHRSVAGSYSSVMPRFWLYWRFHPAPLPWKRARGGAGGRGARAARDGARAGGGSRPGRFSSRAGGKKGGPGGTPPPALPWRGRAGAATSVRLSKAGALATHPPFDGAPTATATDARVPARRNPAKATRGMAPL